MSLPVPVLDYTLSEDEMDTCPEPLPLEDFCVDRVICNNIDEWYALIFCCENFFVSLRLIITQKILS